MAEKDTIENFIEVMNKAQDSTRLAVAQQLKDAGFYKGKISGKFDVKLYTALKLLGSELTLQRKFNQQFGQPTVSVLDFLAQRAAEGVDTGTGPTVTKQTYITSASQTAKLLDTVAEDLLGRKLTKAEKAKYTKMLNVAQKQQPSIQTIGKGYQTTKGGIDEQQFLTEKIGATAEAKTNRATDAYAIMMQELGGLR